MNMYISNNDLYSGRTGILPLDEIIGGWTKSVITTIAVDHVFDTDFVAASLVYDLLTKGKTTAVFIERRPAQVAFYKALVFKMFSDDGIDPQNIHPKDLEYHWNRAQKYIEDLPLLQNPEGVSDDVIERFLMDAKKANAETVFLVTSMEGIDNFDTALLMKAIKKAAYKADVAVVLIENGSQVQGPCSKHCITSISDIVVYISGDKESRPEHLPLLVDLRKNSFGPTAQFLTYGISKSFYKL